MKKFYSLFTRLFASAATISTILFFGGLFIIAVNDKTLTQMQNDYYLVLYSLIPTFSILTVASSELEKEV